jgi:nitroreductase
MNDKRPLIDTSIMRDAHALLRGRRSVRCYRPQMPPVEALDRIFASAAMAPSAHNRQPWRYVVATGAVTKARLADVMGVRLTADRGRDGGRPRRHPARCGTLLPMRIASVDGSSSKRMKAAPRAENFFSFDRDWRDLAHYLRDF